MRYTAHFVPAFETESEFCSITPWHCFGRRIWPSFLGNLVIAKDARGARVADAVVRALASHRCGPGSNLGVKPRIEFVHRFRPSTRKRSGVLKNLHSRDRFWKSGFLAWITCEREANTEEKISALKNIGIRVDGALGLPVISPRLLRPLFSSHFARFKM